jgi:hypothetical protein
MEKTLTKKPDMLLRARPFPGTKRFKKETFSFEPAGNPKQSFSYPPVKMPRQPQGYLKCKTYDCL